MKTKQSQVITSVHEQVLNKLARFFTPWILCFILVLPASPPLFRTPLFVAHDYTHVGRITEMVNTLRSGQFPPRWSQHLGFGYGMPLYSFYAPLPYYVGSILVLVGIPATASVALLFFIATWGSSLTMYHLTKKKNGGILIPLASAALFTYLPYRAVDMYVRGALGELWGIWLLALTLLFLQKFYRNPKISSMLSYAFSLALFLLSHNLMVLLGLPLLGAFSVFGLLQQTKALKQLAIKLVASSLLGFAMAAYFLVPMYFEKQHTSVATLAQIQGGFSNHFVYWKQLITSEFGYGGSIAGITDGMSFSLGYSAWLSILLAVLLMTLLLVKRRDNSSLASIGFWLLLLVVNLFFTSSKSLPIWQAFDVLSFVQFPWRFLSIVLVVIPMLFAASLSAIKQSWLKKTLVIATLGLLLFEVKNFTPNPEPLDPIVSSLSDTAFITTELSKTIPDYIHPKLSEIVVDPRMILDPPLNRFDATPSIGFEDIADSASLVQAILAPSDESLTVRANIFDFPGWQWSVDGARVSHHAASDLPVMEVELPPSADDRIITVAWSETPLRKISNYISALSWIGALMLSFGLLVQKRKRGFVK
jgi:hypothetical protein